MEAIFNNSPDGVQAVLSQEQRQHNTDSNEDGLDPNFSFVISTIPRTESGSPSIDLVFATRALLGESPTPLHLAVLNVFYRHANSSSSTTTIQAPRLLQNFIKPRPMDRSDINKSHQIVELLMQHSANMRQPSSTIFCHEYTEAQGIAQAVTPLDMAWRIHSIMCKTKDYDMNEMEALLLSWEEKTEESEGDQRDDEPYEDGRDSIDNAMTAGINSNRSHLSPNMGLEILQSMFGDYRQTKKAYSLHTVTSAGFSGQEFASSTVVCGKGFHLLCNG